MSCENCDHTMQNVGGAVFSCPRCGSIKWGDGDYASDVPYIVSRAAFLVEGLDVLLANKAFLEAISDFPDLATAVGLESLRECIGKQETKMLP